MAGMIGRFRIVEAGDASRVERLGGAAVEAAAMLASAPGVATAKGWLGFPFRPETTGPPDLRLAAVSALASDESALDAAWRAAMAQHGLDGTDGSTAYDLVGEAVRVAGSGWGVEVPTDDVEPLDQDEPVLVVIAGDLYPQHVGAFSVAAGPVVAQAAATEGYLGGCGLVSTMLDITSFSCWASARAARRYAFGVGAHREAMAADAREGWHDRSTIFFATFRVRSASGSLLGRSPFV